MIKIYLKEIRLEFVGWIHLTQNRDFSLTLLNIVMNSRRMRNIGCLVDQLLNSEEGLRLELLDWLSVSLSVGCMTGWLVIWLVIRSAGELVSRFVRDFWLPPAKYMRTALFWVATQRRNSPEECSSEQSVGWLVGWLVGWSVGRSVGRSVGWLVGRLVGQSVSH
jgi:hypothetical protein